MPANAAPTIGAACAAGANTETPWSNFADLNAFTTASCISSVWTLIPIQPGAAQEACAAGTAGQIQWTGAAIQYCNGNSWQSLSGGTPTLNGITAATGNQAGIANGAYTIQWNWDTLAGGSAFKLASTSTAAASNAQKMLEISLSGTNGTSGQGTYGAYISNTHTGAISSDIGLYATASGGADMNYGIEGTSSSTNNYNTAGVFGAATGTSGVVYGVRGDSASASGYGVFGTNSSASSSVAIFGQAGTGASVGVEGYTGSTTNNTIGVFGTAAGASGATYGVYANNASATGYAGYFTNSNGGSALATGSGTVQIGSAGTAFTSMGVCTVASYTPGTASVNDTCTGVPASTAVAVSCSASAAFQTAGTVLYARANGTLNQIAANLSAANNVAVTLTCMWVKP